MTSALVRSYWIGTARPPDACHTLDSADFLINFAAGTEQAIREATYQYRLRASFILESNFVLASMLGHLHPQSDAMLDRELCKDVNAERAYLNKFDIRGSNVGEAGIGGGASWLQMHIYEITTEIGYPEVADQSKPNRTQ